MNVSQMHIHRVHEVTVDDPEPYGQDSHLGSYTRIVITGTDGGKITIYAHYEGENE